MCRVRFLVAFLSLISCVAAQLAAPENLKALTEFDGVIIRFDAVEGATGYLGVLGDEESSSVESIETQLYFGNLNALTEYTVIVSAINDLKEPGEPALLVFTTGVGQIKNFRVVTTSASLMTLEWDPMKGVESYIIDPEEDTSMPPIQLVNTSKTADIPSIPTVRMTGDASARMSGLRPMTYYKINIRGLRGDDMGPVTSIRVRTEGSGLVIYNMWTNHLEFPLGGSGSIFKSLDRPPGPYALTITFPCELDRLEVWDAIILNSSDPSTGTYDLLQDEVWMQEKTEVGFNFHTLYNESRDDNCFFDPKEIKVEYGSDAVPSEFTEEFDIPFDVDDWGGGAILYVRVEQIFRGPNQGADEEDALQRRVKPDRAKMAIQVVGGANCSNVDFMYCWNIDRVYNSTVDAADGAYFFVQPEDQWFTNDIGLMFQYDDASCPDRNDWDVYMLVGGRMVEALQESYAFQDFTGTCAD